MSSRTIISGIVGIAVVVVTTAAAPDTPVPSNRPTNFLGSPVASCASAGCHGGGKVGTVGSEQSTWAAGDPHANAYRVLFNDDSTRITTNLRKGDPNRPSAHKDASCLACHTSGNEACYDGAAIANASDGVSCDACHGASSQWLSKHYEPSWKSFDFAMKEKLGFRNTKDLVTRIGTCVGCHVGDSTREVTHDLIAAGHPRLAFEYTRYHFATKYSKHWTEPLPNRDFEVRAWAIGQIVAAKAAIDLVHHRAEHVKTRNIPWPELAEQSCFSCHQGLAIPVKEGSNRALGTADWQPWYLATMDVLTTPSIALFPGTHSPETKPLADLVSEMRKVKPDPTHVQVLASAASQSFGTWLAEIQASERSNPGTRIQQETIRSLAIALAKSGEVQSDWDRVAPHFLAASALYHADGTQLPHWKEPLEKMKKIVNFPQGYNSPQKFDAMKAKALFHEMSERAKR